MNNKKFIYLLIASIGILAIALILYFVVGPTDSNDPNKNKSDELKKYEALYNLTLVDDEEDYYVINGLTMNNQRGENSSHVIAFPSTIDNIKVKKIISAISFTDYKYIKQIIIPEYVEYIGTNEKSSNLCDEIFISCSNLETVEVDSNNLYFSSVDGILYSKDQTKLLLCPRNYVSIINSNKITIKDGVTEIGSYSFYSNSKIVELTLNEELEIINTCAFNNCTLLNKINFSSISKLHTINNGAFNNCDQLVRVSIPSSVTKLGATAFGGCSNLKELYIPSSVVSFGNELIGGSTNCVITTSSDNLDTLKEICVLLGIKNKDKDSRIQAK